MPSEEERGGKEKSPRVVRERKDMHSIRERYKREGRELKKKKHARKKKDKHVVLLALH